MDPFIETLTHTYKHSLMQHIDVGQSQQQFPTAADGVRCFLAQGHYSTWPGVWEENSDTL